MSEIVQNLKDRREMVLEIVKELLDIINGKEITPNEAQCVGDALKKCIEENNESGKQMYMDTGKFCGSPPER